MSNLVCRMLKFFFLISKAVLILKGILREQHLEYYSLRKNNVAITTFHKTKQMLLICKGIKMVIGEVPPSYQLSSFATKRRDGIYILVGFERMNNLRILLRKDLPSFVAKDINRLFLKSTILIVLGFYN